MTLPLGSASVIRGDARNLPLPDESVDLIVTSPPYFALRSYTDGGEHYAGQIGSEATPAEYVAALVDCTREWMRVLKPSGSLFVNLGDKYVADNRGSGTDRKRGEAKFAPAGPAGFVGRDMARQKSLMGLPWRYALACIDDLGLILRAEVIWSKPNGLPESVTDRVRRSHEQWFHFTKQPRYYSAVDEIREPHISTPGREGANCLGGQKALRPVGPNSGQYNPLGKLPGSVWKIPSEPLKVPAELGIDHFAAFPTEWPRRIIAGWSPPGICVECGEGRRPVSATERTTNRKGRQFNVLDRPERGVDTQGLGWESVTRITGYACACPEPTAPTRPAIVLDPFGGTGTVALAAKVLGRHGISVDLSLDYCRLAQWRTNDEKQMTRVRNMTLYGTRNPTKKQIREFEARQQSEEAA